MATYNLFLNASQADSAITNSYRLFQPNGLTGQNLSLYGGNINVLGKVNSTQLYITGGVGEESFINRLTGGIRVAGNSEFDRIVNGVDIFGTSYIQTLTGGLNVTNGGFNVVGNSVNNGSFRNVGSVSVTGPTAITGATRIVGNTSIVGNITQAGSLQASQASVGTLTVNNNLIVSGISSSAGLTSTAGLTVSGPTSIIGNSTLQGITNIVGSLQLNGQPFATQQINNITENKYFLTGGDCLTQLNGSAGGVIQTDNTGLIPRNQGPAVTGDTRGNFSVDFQITRALTKQVAKGNYSSLIGGFNNEAFGNNSSVIGGYGNKTTGQYSAILGGIGNSIAHLAENSVVLGGRYNTGNSLYGVIAGGQFNSFYNKSTENSVILGGRGTVGGYNNNEVAFGGTPLGSQGGKIVLDLIYGIYVNAPYGYNVSLLENSGIFIPPDKAVVFKGIGAALTSETFTNGYPNPGNTYFEIRGIATRQSFQMTTTYLFGSGGPGKANNITGKLFGTDESLLYDGDQLGAYFVLYENSDFLGWNAGNETGRASISLELAYAPNLILPQTQESTTPVPATIYPHSGTNCTFVEPIVIWTDNQSYSPYPLAYANQPGFGANTLYNGVFLPTGNSAIFPFVGVPYLYTNGVAQVIPGGCG
jgi:hypothetical protein